MNVSRLKNFMADQLNKVNRIHLSMDVCGKGCATDCFIHSMFANIFHIKYDIHFDKKREHISLLVALNFFPTLV